MDTLASTLVRHLLESSHGGDIAMGIATNSSGSRATEATDSFLSLVNETMAPSANMTNSTDASSDDVNTSWDVGMMVITLVFFWAFVALTLVLVVKDCMRGSQQSDSAATALVDQILSEEERLEKQRNERVLWYQYYLKPYVMVLNDKNFVPYNNNNNNNNLTSQDDEEEVADVENQFALTDEHTNASAIESLATVSEQVQPTTISEGHVEFIGLGESSEDEVSDEEVGAPPPMPQPSRLSRRCTSCSPTIKIWDPRGKSYTQMEGQCIICFNDYEVGDTLVRSAIGTDDDYCKHVYHYDCMLLWLSKGKKRCPICRHWFVPAQRIKDQMQKEHVTLSQSRHHLWGSNQDCLASVTEASFHESDSSHENSMPAPEQQQQQQQQLPESSVTLEA